MDPDAVWGDERDWVGMGVLDFGGDRRRGRGSFGAESEFGASHCNQWGLCDALFSNYFEDLLIFILVPYVNFVFLHSHV